MAALLSGVRRESPRNKKGKITYEHLAIMCQIETELKYDLSEAVCEQHHHEDKACRWNIYKKKKRQESVLVFGKDRNYRVPNYYAHCKRNPNKEYHLLQDWDKLRPSDNMTLRVNDQQLIIFPRAYALQEVYQWVNLKGLQSTTKKVTSWRTELRDNFEANVLTRISALYSPHVPVIKSSMLRQVVREAVISRHLLDQMFIDLYINNWYHACSLVYISLISHVYLNFQTHLPCISHSHLTYI